LRSLEGGAGFVVIRVQFTARTPAFRFLQVSSHFRKNGFGGRLAGSGWEGLVPGLVSGLASGLVSEDKLERNIDRECRAASVGRGGEMVARSEGARRNTLFFIELFIELFIKFSFDLVLEMVVQLVPEISTCCRT
jgi:hypothetical protein